MPPQPNQYSPITFNNFKPGISDDPGFQYPTEQAQRLHTYRCRSNGAGALIPGPRRIASINGTAWEATTPTSTPGYYIGGIYVTGPVVVTSAFTPSSDLFEIFLASEYGLAAGSGTKKWNLERIRMFEATTPRETIDSDSLTAHPSFTSAFGVSFHETRMNRAAPTQPGIPVIIYSWGTPVAATGHFKEFPNDQAPTSPTPYSIDTSPGISVTHQNRAVLAALTGYSHGPHGQWSSQEEVRWTDANDCTAANLSPFAVFYPERADGYVALASMSANELFLLKATGAVVIQGDMDDPTVLNLPMVAGGGGAAHKPCRTPVGLVYGSDQSGVWTWTHGDSSEHLSPSLLPDFWMISNDRTGIEYAFHCEGNLVFVSNSWLLDLDTKAWWRVEDESVAQYRYWSGFLNGVYGALSYYTNESLVAAHRFDLAQSATSYSWHSHPVRETLDRKVIIREAVLRAKGDGRVTITVTDQDGATTSTTFVVSSTTPHMDRKNFTVSGDTLSVRIESEGADHDTTDLITAPTVYELSLVQRESTRVGAS